CSSHLAPKPTPPPARPHDGLLNNLEPPAPAHQEHVLRERQASFEQRPAHNFVYGVVSAHVFALCYQFAARVEQTRGVKPTRAPEDRLRAAQRLRQAAEHLRVEPKLWIGPLDVLHAHRFNRGLPTDPAT